MRNLRLCVGKGLSLPADEGLTQTYALLARRGAGKTHNASVLAEEMLAADHAIIWIDPIGVAWGLRSHYSIIILGGDHGDIPLEPTAGKLIAEFVVERQVSVILDVSRFGENEMRRFVGEFAQKFYQLNRAPVHVFIDEADEFAPQTSYGPEQAKCLGAIQNLVRRGRARGIGITLISQRSAVLNKSVLTQTEVLIAMQTTAPQDLKAIEGWIKYHGTAEECEKILRSLPKMQQGEACVYSPGWLKILKTVKFRARRSFDSSQTPKAGAAPKKPGKLKKVDLAALSKDMAATIERAKAEDPKLLRAEIAELKRKQAALEKTGGKAEQGLSLEAKRQYEQLVKRSKGREEDIERGALILIKKLGEVHKALDTLYGGIEGLRLPDLALAERKGWNGGKHRAVVAAEKQTKNPEYEKLPEQELHFYGKPIPLPISSNGHLPKGEAAILRAAIQHESGVTREQLTVLTGYKRSSRDAYIQRLKEKGYIEIADNVVLANQNGRAALPDAEPLPTGTALREHWLSTLPAGERKILEEVVAAYPATVSRDQLSEITGYQRSSRDAYIQRLKSRQLVKVSDRGHIIASGNLF